MSQGAFVTLTGFVAREPSLRKTKDETLVADVRVGVTTRYLDRATGIWKDGDSSYYTVNCWRRLADHAKASLRKGDPVMVRGRFRTHTYEDKQGRVRTEIEITADTIGHDLSRGCANYIRPDRQRPAEGNQPASGSGGLPDDLPDDIPDGLDEGGGDTGEGGEDGDGAMAGVGTPPFGTPGVGDPGSDAGLDEDEAVEELHRDLDKAFAEEGELARPR